MEPNEAKRFSQKQVILDNIRYDIIITVPTDGIYRAEWVCSECLEQGAWAPLSGDPAQVLLLAKVGLEVHHSLIHQPGRHNRKPR